jgi:hypothetical protein
MTFTRRCLVLNRDRRLAVALGFASVCETSAFFAIVTLRDPYSPQVGRSRRLRAQSFPYQF